MRKLRESSNWLGQPRHLQDLHSIRSLNSTTHLRPPAVQSFEVERIDHRALVSKISCVIDSLYDRELVSVHEATGIRSQWLK